MTAPVIFCAGCGRALRPTSIELASARKRVQPAPRRCERCQASPGVVRPTPSSATKLSRQSASAAQQAAKDRTSRRREYRDRRLDCIACGSVFVWRASAQARFAARDWPPPKRCGSCAAKHRAQLDRAEKRVRVVSGGLPSLGHRR